jgi:hypothetical protein
MNTTDAAEALPRSHERAVTTRAVLLGLLLSVAIGVVESHIDAYYARHPLGGGTVLVHKNMPMGAVFSTFLVIVLANFALGSLWRAARLAPGELAVVFGITLVSTAAPVFFTLFILGMIAGPDYFMERQSGWGELLTPHFPKWIAPSDEGNAVTWFFEGLPEGQRIPWGAWATPLVAWGILCLAVVFTCYCMVVIMRKQWAERERLTFPLLQLPREMIHCTEPGLRVIPLVKDSAFWVGFTFTLTVALLQTLHALYPGNFPSLRFGYTVNLASGVGVRLFAGGFLVALGFAYLVPLKVSMSVWVFYWVIVAEQVVFRRFGYSVGSYEEYQWTEPNTSWQCFGALIAFTISGFYVARRHLMDVIRKAFTGDASVDDSGEYLSYRFAVFGLIGGLLVVGGWMYHSGMQPIAVLIIVPMIFLCYLAVARIVAQTGLMQFTLPGCPQRLVTHGIGAANLEPSTLTAIGFSYGWFGDVQSTFVSAATHSNHLTADAPRRKRWLALWLLVAFCLTCIATGAHTLVTGYKMGALNMDLWPIKGNFIRPFREVVGLMRHPIGTEWVRMSYFGIGAAGMVFLMVMMHTVPWWPVHPVGFAVASTFPLKSLWMPFAMAWFIKTLAIRFGGARTYRALIPVAIGLILGHFVASGTKVLILLIAL